MRMTKKMLSAAAAVVAVSIGGVSAAAATPSRTVAASEQVQLRALYAKAKAEGGKVTVYIGGDAPGQWDGIDGAFAQQFPEVKLHLVNDLSKYHDGRIDNQLATDNLVADAAILQTTQDFDRWKKNGDLLKYKPVGSDKVFANAKDKDGYWNGVFYAALTYVVNIKKLPAKPADFKGADLLKAEYKNKLILTYPNDDDAVLYGYKLIVEQYGWSYLRKLVNQNPKLVRGTPGSVTGVASGDYLGAVATGGDARPNGAMTFSKSEKFVSWAQRGAIFKKAKHPAGAKLFMSWLNAKTTQQNVFATWAWSVRKDVPPTSGLGVLSSYKNTDPNAFAKFMSNRGAVERFRSQVELYVGKVEGPNPADPKGALGRTPGGF